jgi:hypothetical protein
VLGEGGAVSEGSPRGEVLQRLLDHRAQLRGSGPKPIVATAWPGAL